MSSHPFGRGPRAARVLAVVIRAAVWAGARVPARLAHGLAAVGGTLEWALRPAKRRRLADNLAHAVDAPPSSRVVRDLVRAEIKNEARRSADLLWALGRRSEFLATAEYEGIEHAQRAAAEGNGLILASVHVGGWEVATAVPGHVLDVPIAVVVADDWLAWAIEHARVAAGLQVMYPAQASLGSLRHLRAGGALLILGDDSRFSTRSRPVRFLDGEVMMAGGVAALSRLAQAPVLPFVVLPLGPRRWRVTVEPALGPPPPRNDDGEDVLLQALADRFSAMVRASPEHWAAVYPMPWVG